MLVESVKEGGKVVKAEESQAYYKEWSGRREPWICGYGATGIHKGKK